MVENTSLGLPRGLDLRPYDFKTFNKIAYGCPFKETPCKPVTRNDPTLHY